MYRRDAQSVAAAAPMGPLRAIMCYPAVAEDQFNTQILVHHPRQGPVPRWSFSVPLANASAFPVVQMSFDNAMKDCAVDLRHRRAYSTCTCIAIHTALSTSEL